MRVFAKRLKELRKERDLTMNDIAKELDFSLSIIGRWENSKRDITSDNLKKLADYFEVSTDYLLGRSNDYWE